MPRGAKVAEVLAAVFLVIWVVVSSILDSCDMCRFLRKVLLRRRCALDTKQFE